MYILFSYLCRFLSNLTDVSLLLRSLTKKRPRMERDQYHEEALSNQAIDVLHSDPCQLQPTEGTIYPIVIAVSMA